MVKWLSRLQRLRSIKFVLTSKIVVNAFLSKETKKFFNKIEFRSVQSLFFLVIFFGESGGCIAMNISSRSRSHSYEQLKYSYEQVGYPAMSAIGTFTYCNILYM